ncbi:YbjN domain-containing protein [Actinomyces vulturis]|uniref:YbjN domain-containing protein n=1 Tax=Actinomyces vulturis TaxID=1857645 RepID=UPI0008347AE0|nr:YbjN domain-containing protein [Actinomyces vulturis]
MPDSLTANAIPQEVPRLVDQERVRQAVERAELHYVSDEHGNIALPWRIVTMQIVFQDVRALQMRGMWHRIASMEYIDDLRALAMQWNAHRIGPKAHVSIDDDGRVSLHGEYTVPIRAGMTDTQLDYFLQTGVRLLMALMMQAEEVFPDPLIAVVEE